MSCVQIEMIDSPFDWGNEMAEWFGFDSPRRI